MFGQQKSRQTDTRYFLHPQDVQMSDAPSDSISCLEFAPVISQPSQGLEVLACGSWDNQVRLYQMPRVNINPAAPGDNSDKLLLDDRFEVDRAPPFAPKADRGQPLQSRLATSYSHDGPVLDLSWCSDGMRVISGGCDNKVRMYNLATGQATVLPVEHGAPVKCVLVIQVGGEEFLVTAAWDKSCWFTQMSTGNSMPFPLKHRPISMSANASIMVMATSERQIYLWDLTVPNPLMQEPRVTESPLRWQTRTVRCFPVEKAYALGSIEGRIAVQQPFANKGTTSPDPSYSFKCHRADLNASRFNPEGKEDPKYPTGSGVRYADSVPVGSMSKNPPAHAFAVNVIEFNKSQMGTFVSGGGDGSFVFWDGLKRTKLKEYKPSDITSEPMPIQFSCSTTPKYSTDRTQQLYSGEFKQFISIDEFVRSRNNAEREYGQRMLEQQKRIDEKIQRDGGMKLGLPLTSWAYNSDQTVAVYALSYDWSKGHAYAPLVDQQGNTDPETAPKLYMHMMQRHDTMKVEIPVKV